MRASVNHNGQPGAERAYMSLHLSEDGRYRWFGDDGSDTEVSGRTSAEALRLAKSAWSGKDWNFRVERKQNPSSLLPASWTGALVRRLKSGKIQLKLGLKRKSVRRNPEEIKMRKYKTGKLYLSADMSQASCPIFFAWERPEDFDITPFQVADARHSWTRAFSLFKSWAQAQGGW